MTDKEYTRWVLIDTFKELAPAVVIYFVLLGSYWLFVN